MNIKELCDLVLETYMILYNGAYRYEFLFIDNNVYIHPANVIDVVQNVNIEKIPWPAKYPNISLIQNLWDNHRKGLSYRHHFPKNVNGLKIELLKERSIITLIGFNTVTASFKTRRDMHVHVRENNNITY